MATKDIIPPSDEDSDKEIAERLERALQRAVNTSPKPHDPDKPAKSKPPKQASGR